MASLSSNSYELQWPAVEENWSIFEKKEDIHSISSRHTALQLPNPVKHGVESAIMKSVRKAVTPEANPDLEADNERGWPYSRPTSLTKNSPRNIQ